MAKSKQDWAFYQYFADRLNYDKETGVFTWKNNPKSKRVGYFCRKRGYNIIERRTKEGRFKIYAHRLAWFMVYGEIPSEHVRHTPEDASGKDSDNRIANLKLGNDQENSSDKPITGTSQYRNVAWCNTENKWVATRRFNKKSRHIGLFDCEHEAHKKVEEAIAFFEEHGEESFWKDYEPCPVPMSSTGYRHVYKSGEKFRARVNRVDIGTFSTAELANGEVQNFLNNIIYNK